MPTARDDEAILHDPLSDVTRKERRALLVLSAAGIIMSKTCLIPIAIPMLGVKLEDTGRGVMVSVVGYAIAYFLAAFVVYAFSDWTTWNRSLTRMRQAAFELNMKLLAIDKKRLPEFSVDQNGRYVLDEAAQERLRAELEDQNLKAMDLLRKYSYLRIFFELVIPIPIGVYALHLVISFNASSCPVT